MLCTGYRQFSFKEARLCRRGSSSCSVI